MLENTCAVILAAGGDGNAPLPSGSMAEILLKPSLAWAADAAVAAGIAQGRAITNRLTECSSLLPEGYEAVRQEAPGGAAHAASFARDFLRSGGFSHVLVLFGDAPLVAPDDLTASFHRYRQASEPVTALTGGAPEDAVGWWCAADLLLERLALSSTGESAGMEALWAGTPIATYRLDPDASLRIRSHREHAAANRAARNRIVERHYDNGVSIPFPDGIIIGPDVTIGAGSTILPGSVLKGRTAIGERCEIGPNSYLSDAVVGRESQILSSYIDSSTVADHVRIGPMSNIRPGCTIEEGVKIGDFVEVKNSTIGEKTSVAHLTYVGDSDVGGWCNFGCGVVTVNYDGGKKYRTVIGDHAFIGCNTNLVAPVTVGDRVYAAAGTTITEDVPSDALVIGRARQVIKKNWVNERGRYTK